MKETILVTGAAGFVGFNLAKRLLTEGHDVVALDCFLDELYPSQVKRERWNSLSQLVGAGQVELVEFDLRTDDFAQLSSFGISTVINEAAMPGLNQNWHEFRTYYDCNLSALNRLLEWSTKLEFRNFVQASTSSVYGITAEGNETQALLPISPYGVSKLAAEKLLYAYHHRQKMPIKILRYFSIYGPFQRPDMAYARICSALQNDQVFEVYGDGRQRRSNTFVDDVVDATLLALFSDKPFSIYNVAGNQDISLNEAIDVLSSAFNKKLDVMYRPMRIGDQFSTKGDSTLIFQELGWKPKTDIFDGLKKQAESFFQ